MSDVLIRLFLVLIALCYYGAFGFLVFRGKEKSCRRIGFILHMVAFGGNIAMVGYNFILNILENHAVYAPFVSIYQILIFLGVCFTPIYYFIDRACLCKGYKPYFLFAAAIALTGPCMMDIAAVWSFVPALQSVFFVPHIFCYMLSYSLAAVAFFVILSGMIRKKNHDGMLKACVRTLFPFMTLGLFLGAIWADQVWGEFWAWDVKECWSLVTWLNYMLCLHLYRRKSTEKWARVLIVTGFVLVIITFLFSNVLKVSSMHSYS